MHVIDPDRLYNLDELDPEIVLAARRAHRAGLIPSTRGEVGAVLVRGADLIRWMNSGSPERRIQPPRLPSFPKRKRPPRDYHPDAAARFAACVAATAATRGVSRAEAVERVRKVKPALYRDAGGGF